MQLTHQRELQRLKQNREDGEKGKWEDEHKANDTDGGDQTEIKGGSSSLSDISTGIESNYVLMKAYVCKHHFRFKSLSYTALIPEQ